MVFVDTGRQLKDVELVDSGYLDDNCSVCRLWKTDDDLKVGSLNRQMRF